MQETADAVRLSLFLLVCASEKVQGEVVLFHEFVDFADVSSVVLLGWFSLK
jgi:hypothetical protein